jgi:hypothetical protein
MGLRLIALREHTKRTPKSGATCCRRFIWVCGIASNPLTPVAHFAPGFIAWRTTWLPLMPMPIDDRRRDNWSRSAISMLRTTGRMPLASQIDAWRWNG